MSTFNNPAAAPTMARDPQGVIWALVSTGKHKVSAAATTSFFMSRTITLRGFVKA